ncbi:MAG: hydroxyacid dehydrogenase [Candidatus Atribacteria bacterium]|nr:hydroxyacid dehydrogenase [Candidatus Atribacteria bacterium]
MDKTNKKWKFLLTGPIHHEVQKFLELHAKFIISPVKRTSAEISHLMQEQQTDALIVRPGKINKEIMKASPCLQVIVKHGVGYNNIDIDAATELELPVLYTPYANFESVAEHTLALIFSMTKKINLLDKEMKNNKSWPKSKYSLEELKHKCIGLIGMGRIGLRVIQLLSPLEMQVLIYDPFVSKNALPPGVKKVKTVKELAQNADIISIHCPLTKETTCILGKEELNSMKSNAYLINTARGELVDETALIEVLKNGIIAGAALDTFSLEPLSNDNPLLELNNVIVTPHVAGTTVESFIRMGVTAVKLALQVLEGKKEEIPIDHFINREALRKK